jgi:uncharacterized membrane protein
VNGRLLGASILLFIRGGLTAIPGAAFLLFAAIFWFNQTPAGPNESPLLVGGLTVIITAGLVVLGVGGLAIGIPSVIFAVLIQTKKRWAQWAALVGESLIALFFAVALVWGLTHPADRIIAAPAAVALVVLSAPVLFVLGQGLTARRT